ncbi:MAG: 50S ribosomal protein L32 [Microgenomates group bacterium]
MTAVPKHWPSSRRQGRRRATHTGPTIQKPITCKHCGQPKLAGFQCPNCKQN